MRNPLKTNNANRLSHIWSHPFRMNGLTCARTYARIGQLTGTDVTRCDSGPSPRHRLAGSAEPRRISSHKFFWKGVAA